MTNCTDTPYHHDDGVFQAQCAGWRLRVLDSLREYCDTISTLEQPSLHQYTRGLYGESFLLLIAELRQSALRLATMIADRPVTLSDDKLGYLTMLFEDIRNPISSFSMLDRFVQARPPTVSIQDNEVQVSIERLTTIGQNLNHLLDELLRLRSQFSRAA